MKKLSSTFLITLVTILGVFSFVFSYIKAIEISPEELNALLEQNFGNFRILTVEQGGTGASSFTAGQCLVGNGTGAITSQACGGTADLSTAQLGQIGDVSTSTLAYGHLLMYDGTNWQDTATSSLGIAADMTALAHNDLGGLQGGTTDEYYHLSSALYTVVGNTSGTNSGDVTLAGIPNYLTLSGQEITMTVLDINDDTNLVAGTGLSFTGNTLNWSSTGLDWTGNVIGDAYITKTGDWTGTLDTYNGSDLLNANAGTTGQLAYYAGDGSIVSGTSTINVQDYSGVQIGDYTDGSSASLGGTATPILGVQKTWDGLPTSSHYNIGITNSTILNDGGTPDHRGMYGITNYVENNDTSGNVGEFGLYYNVWKNKGDVGLAVGEEYDVYNIGTSTNLYGRLMYVSNTGHASNVYGENVTVSGGDAVNAYGLRVSVYGADNNYGLYVNSGTAYFREAVTIGAYTLPNTDGTENYVLKTNGSGVLSWAADNNTTYTAGGTLLNLTDTTFSLNEGTLTNGKLCTYVTGTGIVCNSDDANTTYTAGTNLTLDGTTFNVDDAFIKNNGDTGTGVYDFGGATSFEIVNGASPTVDAAGEIALDTTSNQLRLYGTADRVIDEDGKKTVCFSIASSSAILANQRWQVGTLPYATTFYSQSAKVVGGTSIVLNFGDGTNDMTAITASTTRGTIATVTNNTFSAGEDIVIETGTVTGTVKEFNICGFYRITPD